MNMMMAGHAAADSFEPGDVHEERVRIGDMAKEHGVSLRTLRFYEDKGLLHPRRAGSTRLYSRRDKGRLKLILLGRKVGFSLREVKQMIDLYEPAGTNAKQLKLALDKSQKQLGRLETQRAAVDESIADLKNLMQGIRGRLADKQGPRSN